MASQASTTRKRHVRAHAVRKGDQVFIDAKWWVVTGVPAQFPEHWPRCPVCHKSMTAQGTTLADGHDHDDNEPYDAIFQCAEGCSDDVSKQPPTRHVPMRDVSPDFPVLAIQRGSRQKVVSLHRTVMVQIIREVPVPQ